MADEFADKAPLCLIITQCPGVSNAYYRQHEQVKMAGPEKSR